MLLGSYSAMSALTQESLNKLLALNKNKGVIIKDDSHKAPNGDYIIPYIKIYYLDVSDQDLSDLNLSQIDFYYCNFYNANFDRSNLVKVITFQCDFRKAHFEDANLRGIKIERKSPLDDATFKNTIINSATLHVNRLVNFENTDLNKALHIEDVEIFEEIRAKLDRSKYILDGGVDVWPYDAR